LDLLDIVVEPDGNPTPTTVMVVPSGAVAGLELNDGLTVKAAVALVPVLSFARSK
jgi:hypothetical protein